MPYSLVFRHYYIGGSFGVVLTKRFNAQIVKKRPVKSKEG